MGTRHAAEFPLTPSAMPWLTVGASSAAPLLIPPLQIEAYHCCGWSMRQASLARSDPGKPPNAKTSCLARCLQAKGRNGMTTTSDPFQIRAAGRMPTHQRRGSAALEGPPRNSLGGPGRAQPYEPGGDIPPPTRERWVPDAGPRETPRRRCAVHTLTDKPGTAGVRWHPVVAQAVAGPVPAHGRQAACMLHGGDGGWGRTNASVGHPISPRAMGTQCLREAGRLRMNLVGISAPRPGRIVQLDKEMHAREQLMAVGRGQEWHAQGHVVRRQDGSGVM